MKRRDAIRLMPLSIAGMAGMSRDLFAEVMHKRPSRMRQPVSLTAQYLSKVRDRLTWIRENQAENLMEAAYAIARTVEKGGHCWQDGWDAGHTESDSWPGRNGEPEIFTSGFNRNEAKEGDLLLVSSSRGTEEFIQYLKSRDIFVVGQPSSWSGDALQAELLSEEPKKLTLRNHADVWIENQATSLGGVVNVPGMPAPIGPVSGVVGKMTIWMMLADACRILARQGVKVKVKGDEPKVTGENLDYKSFSGWISLNDPLMDEYFDETMKQVGMIDAEMGRVKKIAAMAVDTVLNGGQIYGYSRYSYIAGEASTRRSGLAITSGIYGSSLDTEQKRNNFKGTSKDCVIMGITKPDDEVDLMFLDLFKKRGMKTASLGPMTRSIKVPEGRTVPKETDIHAGRMCDTYGLFAVPGLDRRICPTSGVVLDQLFWSTMLEVVEQYMERTDGDIPGVFFSAAIKGGMEHMHRMNEVYRDY